MFYRRTGPLLACVSLLLIGFASSLVAQEVPLRNWSAPKYWTKPHTAGTKSIKNDFTLPIPFVATLPCRVADTRGLAGFSGQAGGPILAGNTTRNFQITGTVAGLTTQCNIPTTAQAVSFNLTVVGMNTNGNLIAWPAGFTQPNTSVINWNASSVALGNGAVIPIGVSGSISVNPNVPVGGQTHLVIDVNGYYANDFQTGGSVSENFYIFAKDDNCGAIEAYNSGTGGGTYGIKGFLTGANAANSGGVFGSITTAGAVNNQAGVWGTLNDLPVAPAGCCGPVGVRGEGAFNGIVGVSNDRAVVGQGISTADGSYVVEGQVGRLTSNTRGWGLFAFTSAAATGLGSGGVRGDDLTTSINGNIADHQVAGVIGYSMNNNGVYGACAVGACNAAVAGERFNSGDGSLSSGGYLGWAAATGVRFFNGLSGTGTKSFIEPHPTDGSKMIQYVSIEGPEAGVYFRGRGRSSHGLAIIEVPDYFRMVATEEGLSIHVTPIGDFAQVAVLQMGLDAITLKTNRDVEFFYTVNSVRKAYPKWDPIQDADAAFIPAGPDAKMPRYLSSNERARLVSNGTYNADGSVNMDNAKKMGWDKGWAKGQKTALDKKTAEITP